MEQGSERFAIDTVWGRDYSYPSGLSQVQRTLTTG